MAWAGFGLALAAEVVYVTDLTIFTHLVRTAPSQQAIQGVTRQLPQVLPSTDTS